MARTEVSGGRRIVSARPSAIESGTREPSPAERRASSARVRRGRSTAPADEAARRAIGAHRSSPHPGQCDTCVGRARPIVRASDRPDDTSRRHRSCIGHLASSSSEPPPMNEFDSFAIVGDLELLLDQLYYWAQRAQESRSNADDAGLAGRMLEAATANLEAFVTTLLDCFRPLELVPVRMPAADLVAAIAMRARGDLGAASVTVTGGADGIVSVDVAQLTRALSAILHRLDPRGAGLHLASGRPCRAWRTAWSQDRAPVGRQTPYESEPKQ